MGGRGKAVKGGWYNPRELGKFMSNCDATLFYGECSIACVPEGLVMWESIEEKGNPVE